MLKKILIKLGVKNKFILYKLSKSYLKNEGWDLSVKQGLPIDKDGKALPWYTYPSIHFLIPRLDKEFTVFECGSGNSTLWYSSRVKKVVAIEHDVKWYSRLKEKLDNRTNVDYLLKDLGSGEYQDEILNYCKVFDVIVIDGRQRIKCAQNSLNALKDNGVIVWDNTDRIRYEEGFDFLFSNGFKRIDFWGMGPINHSSSCTSIFYKEENCLGI